MAARKKPIRPSDPDDGALRWLYFEAGRPRDQYKQYPEELEILAQKFRALTGRDDSGPELLRYIQNQQKARARLIAQGREPWPTFDGAHKRAPSLANILNEDRLAALRIAYERTVLPYSLGTDSVAWNEEVLAALAREFTRLTGVIMPGMTLSAIVEERRKRGDWFKVGRNRQTDFGFEDLDKLDEAAGQDDQSPDDETPED